MNPSSWTKKPYAELFVEMDTTPCYGTGDSLGSLVSLQIFDGTTDVSSTMLGTPGITGNKIKVLVMGGTKDKTYWMRIRIASTLGEKIEEDLKIKIKDKGQ